MRTIAGLRWWIASLLFASTVINYIDRQSLAVVAPFVKHDYHWSNEDFALVVIAFRAAYSLGQFSLGRFIDRVGTRNALSIGVLWYSISALLTPLAGGLKSLCTFRFLLGAGEAMNWPAATKAVSEWFPARERSWAVAFFDSGSAIGAAAAPFAVLGLMNVFGSWRPALAIPGVLGFIWLLVWRAAYRVPEQHPRLSAEEREMILEDRAQGRMDLKKSDWRTVLRVPATWGIVFGRSLTDPVWYFVTDWFAIYIASKKIPLAEGVLSFWIPFLAADIGNFLGGGVSSWLIRRGWNTVRARKAVIVVCGIGMATLAGTVMTSRLSMLVALFSVSTCCYAAWSTMALTLPSDLYPNEWVASISGLSGGAAGVGTIISTFLIGWTADHYSFAPILVTASLVPLVATALVLMLVRTRRA